MATRTITSNRFTPPTKCVLVGDKGDGWQQLGQVTTWDDAERLRQDLAWVYRTPLAEIKILEHEDDER